MWLTTDLLELREAQGTTSTDLYSTATGYVSDLICEGPIEGFMSDKRGSNPPLGSVMLDETFAYSKGTAHYSSVKGWVQYGGSRNASDRVDLESNTTDSTALGFALDEGATKTYTTYGVGQQVFKVPPLGGSVLTQGFSITPEEVDEISVTIKVPALYDADNDKGTLNTTSVSYKIYMDLDYADDWRNSAEIKISGKARSQYKTTRTVVLPKGITFSHIKIKVIRLTSDNINSKIQNDIFWDSYTIISNIKYMYPHSAVANLSFGASQFGSFPKRGYEIRGLKVKVPTNYSPYNPGYCSAAGSYRKDICEVAGDTWTSTNVGDTLYSGPWTGEFKAELEWTNNPAWIFYDLCTNPRYGLGDWLKEDIIDKWSLYSIAQYCDAVDSSGKFVGVPSGYKDSIGVMIKEARFTCNLYLAKKKEAYKVITDLSSVFRGMLYWQEGVVVASQDSPSDSVAQFTQANVVNGEFTYEGSSNSQRHNVALVTWNDPQDLYVQKVEYVENRPALDKDRGQQREKSLLAVGCTSKAQARRLGKWLLYTEEYETEIVTFSSGLEGAVIRPGDLIKISDAGLINGGRYGGRVSKYELINEGQEGRLTVDAPVPVLPSTNYKLSIMHTSPACLLNGEKQLEETEEACINANTANTWAPYTWVSKQDIITDAETPLGGHQEFSIDPLSETPLVGTIWSLEGASPDSIIELREYKVLSVVEEKENIYTISALEYHSTRFDKVDNEETFSIIEEPDSIILSAEVPPPYDVQVHEELYTDSRNKVYNRCFISWSAPIRSDGVPYPFVSSYHVEYRYEHIGEEENSVDTSWQLLAQTSALSATLSEVPEGVKVHLRVKTRRVY
jgi:hypothetical protein